MLNKGQNGANHGQFIKLYVFQESCKSLRQLHIVKIVVRKFTESCEISCEKVVRKFKENFEKVF